MSEEITYKNFVGRKVIVTTVMPVPACAEEKGQTVPVRSAQGGVAVEQMFEAHLLGVSEGVVTLERMLPMADRSVHANVIMLPLSAISMVLAKIAKEASVVLVPGLA